MKVRYLSLLLGLLGFISTECRAENELPTSKHMVDTHIHLYDTEREGGVPWPPKHNKGLYRPVLPADFAKAHKGSGLSATVIVEASTIFSDNQWILDLVKDDPHYIGLVGNLDMSQPIFESQLKQLIAGDQDRKCRFVGLRLRGRPVPDLANEVFVKNLKVLAEHDRSLDVLIRRPGALGIEMVVTIAKTAPDLRIIVNHLGRYKVDGKPIDPAWAEATRKLAAYKNVYMKISGLFETTVQKPAPLDTDYFRTILDHHFKTFGPDRLIYGSNWPLTELTADYTSYVKVIHGYFQAKGREVSEKLYWRNANQAYKLGLK